MPITYVVSHGKYPVKGLGKARTLAGAKQIIKNKGGFFKTYQIARIGTGRGPTVSKYQLRLDARKAKLHVVKVG